MPAAAPIAMGHRAAAVANYGALALAAAAGLVVNAVIAWFYTVETLGVFNQVYAVYVVASQLGAAGIHLATLSISSREADGAGRQVLASAAAAVGLTGSVGAIALVAAAPSIARALASPGVAQGLTIVAVALPLFGIAKCVQASLVARGRMSEVALLQAVRAGGLVVAIVGCVALEASGPVLAASFVVAEVAVLLASAIVLRRAAALPGPGDVSSARMSELLAFGAGSFVGSMLQELNIRIDLLVIGLLLDDREVGIYSFAGLIAEGMLSAIAVMRNLNVPALSAALADSGRSGLPQLVGTVWLWTCAGAFTAAALGVGAAWAGLRLLYGAASPYLEAVPLIVVLLAAIALVAGILAFDFVFVIAGRPMLHSLAVGIGVVANLLLNLALIPVYGLSGAAIATALATMLYAATIVVLARSCLGVWLLPIETR